MEESGYTENWRQLFFKIKSTVQVQVQVRWAEKFPSKIYIETPRIFWSGVFCFENSTEPIYNIFNQANFISISGVFLVGVLKKNTPDRTVETPTL